MMLIVTTKIPIDLLRLSILYLYRLLITKKVTVTFEISLLDQLDYTKNIVHRNFLVFIPSDHAPFLWTVETSRKWSLVLGWTLLVQKRVQTVPVVKAHHVAEDFGASLPM